MYQLVVEPVGCPAGQSEWYDVSLISPSGERQVVAQDVPASAIAGYRQMDEAALARLCRRVSFWDCAQVGAIVAVLVFALLALLGR